MATAMHEQREKNTEKRYRITYPIQGFGDPLDSDEGLPDAIVGYPPHAGLGGLSPNGNAEFSTVYLKDWNPKTPWVKTAEGSAEKAEVINHDQIGSLIRLQRTVKQPADSQYPQRVVLQQWEGVVTGLREDAISAELLDLTDSSKPLEVLEILLEAIPVADRPLMKPGSIFYWWIGRESGPGGKLTTVSEIRARRMPYWSESAIAAMEARAEALFKQLNFNDE